jgi:long-chain acyl-CoA synthetase
VPPGEAGEVVGHSGGMMTGYHGQPELKTREAEWFAPDGKRFIRTGDVGRFDADGFLTLFDRKQGHDHLGRLQHLPQRPGGRAAPHPAVAERRGRRAERRMGRDAGGLRRGPRRRRRPPRPSCATG